MDAGGASWAQGRRWGVRDPSGLSWPVGGPQVLQQLLLPRPQTPAQGPVQASSPASPCSDGGCAPSPASVTPWAPAGPPAALPSVCHQSSPCVLGNLQKQKSDTGPPSCTFLHGPCLAPGAPLAPVPCSSRCLCLRQPHWACSAVRGQVSLLPFLPASTRWPLRTFCELTQAGPWGHSSHRSKTRRSSLPAVKGRTGGS